MGFQVGDRVRVNMPNTNHDLHGRTGKITDSLYSSSFYDWKVLLDNVGGRVPFRESELVLLASNEKAASKYKLTHKTNGSVVTVVAKTSLPSTVINGLTEGWELRALIEGTSEPEVQFILSEWDFEEVKPAFVFPTKRSAIIEAPSGLRYIRARNGGWIYKYFGCEPQIKPQSELDPGVDWKIIFEGTD